MDIVLIPYLYSEPGTSLVQGGGEGEGKADNLTAAIFTAIDKGDRYHPWTWILSKRQLTTSDTNRSHYIKINVIQSGVIKKQLNLCNH